MLELGPLQGHSRQLSLGGLEQRLGLGDVQVGNHSAGATNCGFNSRDLLKTCIFERSNALSESKARNRKKSRRLRPELRV